MLKILIADDEPKVVQLIQKLIDWQSLNMELTGIAHNGLEAYEKIEILYPDIVITDIRMPGLDGLDLVKKSRELGHPIEFIIISGYRHFEYAQTALKYGVSDYLLKPIKKTELMETLTKLKSRYEERHEQLTYEERVRLAMKSDAERLRTNWFSSILYRENSEYEAYSLSEINSQYYYRFQPGYFQIICLKFDGNPMAEEGSLEFMAEKTNQIVQQQLSDTVYDFELYVEHLHVYLLLNYRKEDKRTIRRQCKAILNDLIILESILQGVQVTVGFGDPVEDISQLRRSLQSSRYLIEQRLVAGTGKLLEGEIKRRLDLADGEWFARFNQKMNTALESLDRQLVRECLEELKADLLKDPQISGHDIIQMCREVCNVYQFFMKGHKITADHSIIETFNQGSEHCSSASELLRYLRKVIISAYDQAVEGKLQEENRPIRIAKQYIKDNFSRTLTLEEVSGAAGFNPTYFSSLFKKETGKTFLEYLSWTRMEQAKNLLKETNRNVADICEAVGYSDVKYFTRNFTKYTGLKPNEYRKLYS